MLWSSARAAGRRYRWRNYQNIACCVKKYGHRSKHVSVYDINLWRITQQVNSSRGVNRLMIFKEGVCNMVQLLEVVGLVWYVMRTDSRVLGRCCRRCHCYIEWCFATHSLKPPPQWSSQYSGSICRWERLSKTVSTKLSLLSTYFGDGEYAIDTSVGCLMTQ